MSMQGYTPQMQGGYYNQAATPGQYPPQQPGQYPPQQPGQYPSQQPGQYPPQQPGQYPPQQPGQYPPQQPGQYPPQPQVSHEQQKMQSTPSQQNMGANVQQPQTKTAWDPANAQQYQGDIGNEDLDENAASEPVEGSAPPPIDATLPGYENVAFTSEMPAGPPPSYEDCTGEAAIVDTSKMRSITAEEAQEALVEYVNQQCCYGSGAAKDMKIKDIKSSSAFHYTLETFTEGRSTKWHYVPYSGGFVDGPHMGPAPGPWDIQCGFSALFQSEVKKMEVPHTASVRPCHHCFGQGFERCWRCYGRGRIRCSFCNGSGRRQEMREGRSHNVPCNSCNGSGRKRCYTCNGTGCTRCRECKGFGQIKQYIQLTVNFSNHLTDHIVERTDMPDHLIRGAAGDTILEQVAPRIGPVQNFMEEEINRQSSVIVNTHATSFTTERMLQQRQKLTSVPVYECDFKFNDKHGRFWVYGNQRSVHTTDYPHTCFCCNIL